MTFRIFVLHFRSTPHPACSSLSNVIVIIVLRCFRYYTEVLIERRRRLTDRKSTEFLMSGWPCRTVDLDLGLT